jgi:antitoxin HicB
MDSGVFHVIRGGILYELEPDGLGGYMISVPALPGCISVGQTIEEALEMIKDATEGWLAVAREEGFEIPAQFDFAEAS